MEKVSIVKCENYEHDNVKNAIKKSLDLIGGLSKFVKPGNTVLLKVNAIIGFPAERAATTHPAVVRAMAELVKEAGGIPLVGDSSGAFGFTGQSLEMCGIEKAASDAGAKLVNFESTGTYPVKVNGKILKTINIAKPVIDCDVLISMPKLKTHQLAPSEESLSHAVVDVYSAIKPALAVMDGIVGMEGEGATNGTPADSKVIISGADCVSVDAVASEVMGFFHKDIMITRFAHERGLGVGMLDEIEVVGEKIKDVKLDFKKSKYFVYKFPDFIRKYLFGFAEKLSSVGISEDICKKCIKCYCCHELCPNGAVELKTSFIGKQLLKRMNYKS
ncbi:MAG: DUF362 domain-containing protein [Euryarchaeota archaeon]|nr:DUF362 domain-containing protein [Euryarchaeota archaeon]MBU4220679.1 DUF362 domain-containing protein [Euryarchaeota archaeon]MBU4339601.1 DUF362 domain-containing protein [Euryarchaeota archaeon]